MSETRINAWIAAGAALLTCWYPNAWPVFAWWCLNWFGSMVETVWAAYIRTRRNGGPER